MYISGGALKNWALYNGSSQKTSTKYNNHLIGCIDLAIQLDNCQINLPIIDSGLGDTDPDFGKLGLDTAEEEASETVNDVDDEGVEDNA